MLPWSLALLGLAIPLVGSGFVVWPLVTLWLAGLGLVWLVGRRLMMTRTERIITALLALLLLLVLAWEGGLWLIPADLAWLAIEVLDRGQAPAARDATT
jgi:hypothetical protein